MNDGLDVERFGPTLDLFEVRIPAKALYVVGRRRVYLTSIEYWNTRTTLRFTWPVAASTSADGAPPDGPLAVDENGVDYGLGSASGGGDDVWADMAFSTAVPVPASAKQLTLRLGFGWTGPVTFELSRAQY